jgi:hypothetical protein
VFWCLWGLSVRRRALYRVPYAWVRAVSPVTGTRPHITAMPYIGTSQPHMQRPSTAHTAQAQDCLFIVESQDGLKTCASSSNGPRHPGACSALLWASTGAWRFAHEKVKRKPPPPQPDGV